MKIVSQKMANDKMCYTISNKKGMTIKVLNYGAILQSVFVPDKDGKYRDVVLGYDDLEEYEKNPAFLGATIGRNCNRIADACFSINGNEYKMEKNDSNNNLHSGPCGYEHRLWDCEEIEDGVKFSLISEDGDQGFPGCFKVEVSYILTEDNGIKIKYEGISDKDTVANMTNHSYFNLNGHNSGSILDHKLMINAQYFTPVEDEKAIPTGKVRSVLLSAFDFTKSKPIGKDINASEMQLEFVGGYDHNYVLDTKDISQIAAILSSEKSGIEMILYTTCPALQLYTGNGLSGANIIGKDNYRYMSRDGICLETQFSPNAINCNNFNSPIIKAGEKYISETIYKFNSR